MNGPCRPIVLRKHKTCPKARFVSGDSAPQTVRLIPRNPQPGMLDAYVLQGDQTTVGRHPSNDIVLALDSISRFHARIDRRGKFHILQDLNSSNGSAVNGERVTQIAIHHGDQVTFGNVEFVMEVEGAGSLRQGEATPGSLVGRAIVDVDFSDVDNSGSAKSFVKVEDFQSSKARSSVTSSVADKKVDKATLVKLNQRLSALYRLSELLRDADLDSEQHTLERVLDVLFVAVPADRGVMLTRFHKDSENLDVIAVKYRDQPIVPQKVTVSRAILKQVLSERVGVLSRDAQTDERFSASESILVGEVRSTIAVPMIVGDELIGVVHLDTTNPERTFEQKDLEFVMIVATESGVALSNMRMRKEAVHRQRLAAVGETVAGISHNVKNILLLSQGGAELLSRAIDKKDIEGVREAWQVVSRGIEKIGKLVRDMLEFSSNKKAELAEVDVNEMICSIAEEIEEQLVSKSITLELDLDESVKAQLYDDLGLQRTLMNLIINSVEAISHQQGLISVSTSARDGRRLIITLRDNGAGISADKMEKIFFPFFTTKGSSGTGLGLPMCKKCIEDMQGTITCESEENVGTTFTLELPYAAGT